MPVTPIGVAGIGLSGGRGTPRSAVDVRKAPSSPNGHGPPGRLSVAAGAGGPSLFAAKREKAFSSIFPPGPPSLPQRAFIQEDARQGGAQVVPSAAGLPEGGGKAGKVRRSFRSVWGSGGRGAGGHRGSGRRESRRTRAVARRPARRRAAAARIPTGRPWPRAGRRAH